VGVGRGIVTARRDHLAARAAGRAFRSLALPNYRLYLAGSTVSLVGTWVQRIGQDWLVLQLTHSGTALGISNAFQFVPVLFGGLWAGVVVDRYNRRRILMITQAVSAVLAAALGLLIVLGAQDVIEIYAMGFALGCVTIFDTPCRQAYVVEIVGPEHLLNAQSLYSLVYNGARLVGPVVGGFLIDAAGVAPTFFVNAASFLAVIASLLLTDPAKLHQGERVSRAPRQVREGLRFAMSARDVRMALVLITFVSVFGQNFRVVFPLLASQIFHGGAQTYGLLTAALGLGAVLGALVTAAGSGFMLAQLVGVVLVFGAANALVAISPSLWVALAVTTVLGAANMACNTLTRNVLLARSPASMRGRSISLYSFISQGSTPIGGPAVGYLCSVFNARAGLLVGAVAAIIPAGLMAPGVFSRHRRSALDAEDGPDRDRRSQAPVAGLAARGSGDGRDGAGRGP
jgi:MFS family permease